MWDRIHNGQSKEFICTYQLPVLHDVRLIQCGARLAYLSERQARNGKYEKKVLICTFFMTEILELSIQTRHVRLSFQSV